MTWLRWPGVIHTRKHNYERDGKNENEPKTKYDPMFFLHA